MQLRATAVLIKLLLLLPLVVQQVSGTSVIAVMQAVPKCPSPASLGQLHCSTKAKYLELCIVACAQSHWCSAVYFSPTESLCYHGNASQRTEIWNQQIDGCVSYIKDAPAEASTAAPASSIPGLSADLASKLLIFFDFRQGYTNLADPTKFLATPFGGVVRDSQGAAFPGNSADFIEVDTNGNTLASENLDYANNFTFYASVIRQAWSHQNYHYFHDCSANLRGEFGDHDGMLWTRHTFSNQVLLLDKTETIQSVASNLVPTDNTPSHVSAAAVYTGIHFSAFYFNSTAAAGSSDLNYSFQGLPMCLRLGYHSNVNFPLRGRFICYAIAKAALSAGHVAELGQFCAV